jgi:solute carrier family 15 (oligopeptide transporter), member 1
VLETKILLNVLVLYLPLPFFWALFDQQGSRWTFQATRMTGDIGFYTIKPDQMQVVNPLLILVFIPLYEVIFYPLLNLVGIRRPLQKIALGGVFAGVAFLCSMFVEINLEPTYPVLPKPGEAQFRIFNGLDCDFTVNSNMFNENVKIAPNSHFMQLNIELKDEAMSFPFILTSTTPNCGNAEGFFDLKSNEAKSFFIKGAKANPTIQPYDDDPEKSVKGTPLVRVLANLISTSPSTVVLRDKDGDQYKGGDHGQNLTSVPSSVFEIFVDGVSIRKDVEMKLGGVYTITIQEKSSNNYASEVVTITSANSLSMLWLIPQYVIMTLGEVMFSVTGLQFSFTQAPESMKSVLQGCWQLTVGFGNLITTLIVFASIFKSQTLEFALFAGLMFVDMAVFAWLAYRFKGISLDEIKKIEEEEEQTLHNSEKKEPLEFPGTSDGTREARID